MSSLFTDQKSGSRVIQFVNPLDNSRRTIRLGKIPLKGAEAFQSKLDSLIFAKYSGTSPEPDIAKWIAGLPLTIAKNLAEWGLIAPRVLPPDLATLAAEEKRTNPELINFIDAYVDSRKDVKPATRRNYGQTRRLLVEYLESVNQEHIRIKAMTTLDAKKWRNWLSERLPSENTVRMHCKNGRLFFNAAKDGRLVTENPFKGIPCSVVAVPERLKFITAEDTRKVMAQAPDIEWKVLIALARWGALRIPSEIAELKWDDILWDINRITIMQPKLERHPGKSQRQVPLFPELFDVLNEAWFKADDDAVYVLPRLRGNLKNFRTTLTKLVSRAGLPPWPEPFLTLRSTRDTELARTVPLKAVSAWLGHDPKVSMDSYQQVRQEDWDAVTQRPNTEESAAFALHTDAANHGKTRQKNSSPIKKP